MILRRAVGEWLQQTMLASGYQSHVTGICTRHVVNHLDQIGLRRACARNRFHHSGITKLLNNFLSSFILFFKFTLKFHEENKSLQCTLCPTSRLKCRCNVAHGRLRISGELPLQCACVVWNRDKTHALYLNRTCLKYPIYHVWHHV